MEQTSIRLYRNTKDCLDLVKRVDQESYDNVIKRLLYFFTEYGNSELNAETIKLVESRIKDVKEGRVISAKELKRRLFGNKDEI